MADIADDIDALVQRMIQLHEQDKGPFPYDDLRLIRRTVTSRKKLTRRLLDSVNPDLNLYFMEISGSCSWGNRAKSWPRERRQQIAPCLQLDFFGRFPKYEPLRRWISESQTPSLYRDLVLHDEMRLTLLAFLSLTSKADNDIAPAETAGD